MKRLNLLILIMLGMSLLSAASFSQAQECSISIYTDKPLYGPSDRVYIYGMLDTQCENASNADVAVEVIAPNRNRIFIDQVRTGMNGQFSTSFVMPSSMPTGTYTTVVSSKGTSGTKTFECGTSPDTIILGTGKTRYIKSETVHISGMLVKEGAAARDEMVAIIVKDKAGNIVYVSQPNTDSFGAFSETFRTTPSMQTGECTVYAAHEYLITESVFYVYPNIIINELMFHPSGGDAAAEFIELYNPYDEDADISGWYIKSSTGAVNALAGEDPVLAGGSFAVITSDMTAVPVPGSALHLKAGASILGSLPDTGATITLFDDNDSMIDSFTYRSTYGSDRDASGVIDSDGEGSSLERISPYVLTNYYANWDSGIGAATPGAHNTIYTGYANANISLLFADIPRYVMAQTTIELNARVKNSAAMYDLVNIACTSGSTQVASKPILLDPLAYRERTIEFTTEAGDLLLNITAESAGDQSADDNRKEGIITVFPPIMNDSEVIELYTARMLIPPIVPRGSTFHVISVLANEYDGPVTDISVTLALPQAGGFQASAPLTKTVPIIAANSVDISAIYEIHALADTPDELLGKRTFSLYSQGTVHGEETHDASSGAVEIINHSSPVLSLDLAVQKEADAGETVHLIGAAFNTGTEPGKNIILTIEAEGLEVLSEKAVVINELSPSSFEMYSFDVMAEDGGDYEIILEIRDQEENSYTLERTLHVKDSGEETSGADKSTTTGSTSGDSSDNMGSSPQNAAPEESGENDAQVPDDSADEASYTFEEDDDAGTGSTEAQDIEPEPEKKAPTGRVFWYHVIPRIALAILAVLLITALLLKPKDVLSE